MRLYSAYININAAKRADSVFQPELIVRKIYKDGKDLWELTELEKKDYEDITNAEKEEVVPKIEKEELEEIKDIEDLANRALNIIRDSILLIHTQLESLKKLAKENDVLKKSGFPIEVADEIEAMLKKEISNIIKHLREMAADLSMASDSAIEASRTEDSANSSN